MYTPTSPSAGSPTARPGRHPSRHPPTSATPTKYGGNASSYDNGSYDNHHNSRPTTSGQYSIPQCPPSRGAQSLNGTIGSGRIGTANSNMSGSHGNGRIGGGGRGGFDNSYNGSLAYGALNNKEERTIVGTGTTGSGAVWEAQQQQSKQQHLEEWERNKKMQLSADATRREQAKQDEDRKMETERKKKRDMMMANRFTGGMSPDGGVSHTLSAADRRERSVLPAAATSPLRHNYYLEVVKNKNAFVREKAEWAKELGRQQIEHAEYIDAMRHAPLSSSHGLNSGNSSARAAGRISGSDTTGSSNNNNQRRASEDTNAGGDGYTFGTPQRHSQALGGASPTPRRSSALPRLNGPFDTTHNTPGNSRLNSPNRVGTAGSNNCYSISGRDTHRSSPPPEVAAHCHRVVVDERYRNEADVQAQRDAELMRSRESRHAVVASHYQTYKAVKDCGTAKAEIVSKMAKEKALRQKQRKALTEQIREEKAMYQSREREQTVNRVKAASAQRYRTARVNAEREDLAEHQRLEEREKVRKAELRALQQSADARKVIFSRGNSPTRGGGAAAGVSPRVRSDSIRRGSSPFEEASFYDS